MGTGLSKNRIKGLSASVDQNSAVLILGTLPGRVSLTYGKYYADPSNKFWDILFIACGEKIDKTDQGKKQLLEKYHIALWDILYSAVRKTSNDKDISDETPNDLPLLLSQYPNIKLLVFHSNDAYKYFNAYPHQAVKIEKAPKKKRRSGEPPYLAPFHNSETGQGWRGRGHPHVI